MCSFGDEPLSARSAIDSHARRTSVLLALHVLPRLLAVVVLAIYLPVMIGVGLLVLFTSSGPAFVKKAYRRRGKNGANEVVYLYEFRTECWQTWRETRVGSLLRSTDLHRLPRLANVLTGEIGVGERVQRVAA